MANPTYQSGFYAPGRGVAKHPELWRGIRHAWVMSLGNTGRTLIDQAGMGNSPITSAAWSTSQYGDSLNFNGSSDQVQTGINPAGSGDTTLVAFFRSTSSGQRMIFGNGNANRFYIEQFTSGILHWGFGDIQNSATSNATLAINQWQHFAVRKKGLSAGTVDQFLNGVATDTGDSWSGSHGGSMSIGVYANNLYFDGDIQSVLWYDRCLSDSEIRLLARDPVAMFRLAPRKFYSLPAAAGNPTGILQLNTQSMRLGL